MAVGYCIPEAWRRMVLAGAAPLGSEKAAGTFVEDTGLGPRADALVG